MKLNLAERLLVNSPVRLALQKRVLRRMRAAAWLRPGADILEIGCGRGEGARLLDELLAPRRMFLMDLDPAMARLARGKGHAVLVGDAEALPLCDSRLDAVFGFGFLHHVPDWRAALQEVARVLRPGGFYFLEEYYPATYQNLLTKHLLRHPREDRFYSPDLRQGLEAAGFRLESCWERGWWGMVAAARKG